MIFHRAPATRLLSPSFRAPMSLMALVASAALVSVTACTDPPVTGEGEGEGEVGEGEGEVGEGEGEARPLPTVSITSAPSFGVPADGITAIQVTLQLAGEDISGRAVALTTLEAGPTEVAGQVSDDTGVLQFTLTSSVAGTFNLEVTVDGEVVDAGGAFVTWADCTSIAETFRREAYPVALSRCVGCHNEFGFAPSLGARFILPLPGDDDFGARGVDAVRRILALNAEEGSDVNIADLSEEQRAQLDLADGQTTVPRLLANPLFGEDIGHTGGKVFKASETREIARFQRFVARVTGDDTCGADSEHGIPDEDLLAVVEPLSLKESFKRAQLSLADQNAPASVLNTIVDEASYESAIDNLLTNRRAENRLAEIWNDWLLTDAKAGDNPVYVGAAFPNRFFFNQLRSEGARGNNSCDDSTPSNCCRVPNDDNSTADDDINAACEAKRLEVRQSTGREPMEFMRRLWRDGLPAETILQADFTVVDPSLARTYGLLAANGRTFLDGDTAAFNANTADDGTERRITRIINTDENIVSTRLSGDTEWPHQGVLSMPAWLSRYPTTTSNRQRTRARMVYEQFLGVPVMKLAAFATPEIPPGQSLENLTWDTQPCVVCHTLIDPVAGAFNHFTGNGGNILARRNCRLEGMRSPGFGYVDLPGEGENGGVPRPALDDVEDCIAPGDGSGTGAADTKSRDRLAWIADRVTEHPRFAYGVTVPLYEGLLGIKLTSPPDSLDDPDFEAKARAFIAQQRDIADLMAAFRAGGGRYQPVVKAILMSRAFRADAAVGDVDEVTARTFEFLGLGHKAKLMTPEQLDRRLTLLTGLPWNHVRSTTQAPNLQAGGSYNVFMGGIDSENVTLRSREPVAIRAAIARRLGHEVSCIVVPQEFSIVDPAQRKLFRLIEADEVPIDDDGAVDTAVEARVKAQIRRLHAVLWNEEVLDAEEVDASYALFLAALREMRAPVDGSTTPNAIGGTCQAVSSFNAGTRTAYPATGTVLVDDVEHRRVNTDPDFTVRAWMAVLSTILADARFILE